MVDRNQSLELRPRRDVVMWHVCLRVLADGGRHVVITNNPLDHAHRAQVVMHKTRSHGVATQVARYVRRRFDVEEPVTTHRAPRPVEAMIGYACAGGYQHPPSSYDPEVFSVVRHVAATRVADLLKEVAGGHNAARTRYVVYEVRCAGGRALRGVTHRFDALERRYREAPPDKLPGPVEFVMVGRFETMDEAARHLAGHEMAGDSHWNRRPSVAYMRSVLAIRDGGIVWTCDGSTAVREYDFRAVCVGPHVYTERQVRHLLEHGEWVDGRTRGARRIAGYLD